MTEGAEETVRDNPAAHRYELSVNGHVAFIAYKTMPGGLVFVHTEVPDALGGRGVGGRLVNGALTDMRRRGLKVRPDCPFVAGYVQRHPEFQDVVVAR
jgi:predicted GNAT family acetyltransferase